MKESKAVSPPIDSRRWFVDELGKYLARKNLKQTKQRQALIDVFLGAATHVSAEELHSAARGAGLDVGLATVYRTLNLLVDAKIVEQKQFSEGRFVYEIAQPGGHHDHLICLDCGIVIEFANDEIERLQEKVAAAHKFKLTSHRLDLFGHCQKQNCERRAGN